MQYATTDHHVTTFWPSFTHFGMFGFVMLFQGGNFFASENTEALVFFFPDKRKVDERAQEKSTPNWLVMSCHVVSCHIVSRHVIWCDFQACDNDENQSY